MRYVFIFSYLIFLGLGLTLALSDQGDEEIVTKALEEAYFEGQRDALTGDVRISKTNDGCWVWTKSCWDSGRTPIFNPSIICDGNK